MVTQEELEKMSPKEIAQLQKQNCIFCKIVAGEIPGAKIFENKTTVSILDINPAKKGHALVMPKEHFPILPLVPPQTFKAMFLDAKSIATAIKEVTLAASTAIFIANGALAGQQAPHFLFHIIPDHKFKYLSRPDLKEKNDALADALKNNLGIMMKNHARREDSSQEISSSSQHQSSPIVSLSPEELAMKREQIAKVIEENKDVQSLLRTDVQAFRNTIAQNKELSTLFQGVDLEALSRNLQSLEKNNQFQEITELKEEDKSNLKEKQIDEEISSEAEKIFQESTSSQNMSNNISPPPSPKPEVFLGMDPHAQKSLVFKYFNEKPKAKELLIDNPLRFEELLKNREDVQVIFQDVDIHKLSQKLNEISRGDFHE